jgi:RNA polymerase sigma-70 factor (ECF subfamily)
MVESPATRASLVLRLRDTSDHEAWQQFVDVYSSLIYGFLRRRGLQDADAADLMQDVLRSVSSAADRLDYDPQRGSFRGWLFTITRNKMNTFLSRQRRQARGTGDSAVQALLEQGASHSDESEWDEEYQRRIFHWAAEQVRDDFGENTWQAFWLSAVEGKNAKEISTELDMSVGAIYVAKSRVLARIKETVLQLEGEEAGV